MGYAPDLTRLSIQDFQTHLKSIKLLPSRSVLLDSIENNFSALQACGINNVQDLRQALSTPAKLTAISQKTLIKQDYLKILKREIGSLIPKNVPLSEFDIVTSEAVKKLKAAGLRHSKDYFEAYPHIEQSLCETIDDAELYHLCALVRVNGIGALAARIFLEAGYRTAADIALANAQMMVQRVNGINAEKHYYDGTLGVKDMTFCIVHAKMLERYA